MRQCWKEWLVWKFVLACISVTKVSCWSKYPWGAIVETMYLERISNGNVRWGEHMMIRQTSMFDTWSCGWCHKVKHWTFDKSMVWAKIPMSALISWNRNLADAIVKSWRSLDQAAKLKATFRFKHGSPEVKRRRAQRWRNEWPEGCFPTIFVVNHHPGMIFWSGNPMRAIERYPLTHVPCVTKNLRYFLAFVKKKLLTLWKHLTRRRQYVH